MRVWSITNILKIFPFKKIAKIFKCKNEKYELTECNRSGRLDTAEKQTHELWYTE